MLVLGIDPGPDQTAYCLIKAATREILTAAKLHNRDALGNVRHSLRFDHIAIEGMRCQGRIVGNETFQAAYIIGRIQEIAHSKGIHCAEYGRLEYFYPICGHKPPKGKYDTALYAALKLRFGKEHVKPLIGATDLRSAFAVAVFHADKLRRGK